MTRQSSDTAADGVSDGGPTRRGLLASVGGSVGALAVGVGTATGQSGPGDLSEWDPHLGAGVEDVAFEVLSRSTGSTDVDPRPDVSVADDGTVVVERTVGYPTTAHRPTPRAAAYDADTGLLAIQIADVTLPAGGGAHTFVEYRLTVTLADAVPETVRVDTFQTDSQTFPPASSRDRPEVRYEYQDGESVQAPDDVTEYEFEHELVYEDDLDSASPPEREDPIVSGSGSDLGVGGRILGTSEACREPVLERLEHVGDRLHVVIDTQYSADAGDAVSCPTDSPVWEYDLGLEFEDAGPPSVSVLERGREQDYRTTVGDGTDPSVDHDALTGYGLRVESPTNDDTAEALSADHRDGALVVSGTASTCHASPETLDLVGVESADDGRRLVATIGDRTADVPPAFESVEGCGATASASYELEVFLEDQPVETVEVREQGLDGDPVTASIDGLDRPTGIEVRTVTPGAVALGWTDVPGATGYEVTLEDEVVATPSDSRARVTDVAADATQELGVRAVGADGTASAPAITSVTTPPVREEWPIDVTVSQTERSVAGETAVTIEAGEFPESAALRAFDLTVDVGGDAALLEVETPEWSDWNSAQGPFALSHVAFDGDDRVRLEGSAVEGAIPPDDAPVEFASVTHDGDAETPVSVTVSHLVGAGTDLGDPPSLGEYEPRSPEGRELYWDVTGDGERTVADVEVFQEHLFTDAVQENTRYFDFAGDDVVSHADVIELFQWVVDL